MPNATSGVNVAVRSLDLQPGDEILTTQHEYGACTYTWQHACARSGARLVEQAIPLPYTTPEAFVEAFWQGVTPRTRVIYLSHITSPTALIFPVAEICARARAAGIITVIDGAHAPGQIPLDLPKIGADFYTGNCHKWMCTPKGSAFLYVRPERQAQTESVIVSWGWGDDATFISRNQRQGTRDPAAYLSVPAGIDFLAAHDWDSVRARCHDLGVELREQIAELTRLRADCAGVVVRADVRRAAAALRPGRNQGAAVRRLPDRSAGADVGGSSIRARFAARLQHP